MNRSLAQRMFSSGESGYRECVVFHPEQTTLHPVTAIREQVFFSFRKCTFCLAMRTLCTFWSSFSRASSERKRSVSFEIYVYGQNRFCIDFRTPPNGPRKTQLARADKGPGTGSSSRYFRRQIWLHSLTAIREQSLLRSPKVHFYVTIQNYPLLRGRYTTFAQVFLAHR